MKKFELTRMGRVALVDEIISRFESGADTETALLEIRERERNFTPSISARVAEWKESMNNLPVGMAQALIDSGDMTEETTPIPGDEVEYDGVTPNIHGVMIGYLSNGRLQIKLDNGEIVYIPHERVSYAGDSEKEADYDEIPNGTRNFWMFTDAADIEWAKTHIVTLSVCGFKAWSFHDAASSDNDAIGICTGDSDENSMWERLYRNRFNALD